MKSSALRMTPPERSIFCSPWSATGPWPAKGSQPGLDSIPLSSERFPMWFSNARRRSANAIGKIGERDLHHLRDPLEGQLTERHWDA